MVDNITSSILKSETFLFYFCVHLSGGSGVPIFRADAECPSGGLAVASFIARASILGGMGGTRPPQFFEWGGRISNYPPHFLTCLMKFCFLVI